ncbi:hypothetical protein KVF89_16790 [Nocardioides carbamazepini]|uniref:choice-of-anchor P family protein n=1 Tax=Nocardioides carbamazepini TaxID=2854259 RepID=UPI00214A831B|nr:choice-of-anchor P family protein [Nocardioides carbamazepini]MCR1784200.1 hypothetical protein [Nocardioides carbamazepini]
MNVRKFVSFVAFTLLGVGLVAVPAPAHAAETTGWAYNAATGATYVKAIGGVVQSDLTAQTGVSGGNFSRVSENSTVGGQVSQLLTIGAAQTKTTADYSSAGTTLTSWARTAGVSLLNGLIKVDAIETTSVTTGHANGTVTHTGNSELLGIKIIGIDLPVKIPKNFAVTVPGVATVSLNYDMSGQDGNGAIAVNWALAVQLLKPIGGFDIGTTVLVNPVSQGLIHVNDNAGAILGGNAYGTRIAANVGSDIKIVSDPTAQIGVPFSSSGGRTLRNSTASVTVPGLLNLGAITSTSTSSKTGKDAEIVNTNQLAGLNLLGGLIKADAIGVSASGKRVGTQWTGSMNMTLVNLVIAGKSIPIDVSPNTTLKIANLGKVEINKQVVNKSIRANQIYALKITLDTSTAGLPVGAVIEIGQASTIIY